MRQSQSLLFVAALVTALAGCASTQMNAQWSNPEFKGRSLKGQTVLVVCQAPDFTTQKLCEDQLAASLTNGGARAVRLPDNDPSAGASNDVLAAAAKRAGASAVVRTNLAVSAQVANPGPQIGIGIGGFGGSSGRYGSAGGGLSIPVGGASTSEAYAADTTIVDAASGKLIWSGRASTPTGNDLPTQLSDLSRVTTEAMRSAGVL